MLVSFNLILPEIIIALTACTVLALDVLRLKNRQSHIFGAALIGLLVAAFFTVSIAFPTVESFLSLKPATITPLKFYGTYTIDTFSTLIKLVFFAVTAVIFIYSRQYLIIRNSHNGEYFALCLLSMLGMMVLISSANLLTLYLGLELFALPLYALICFVKDNKTGVESAMKYFVMGGIASGLLLYGISLIYGASGSFEFDTLATFSLAHNAIGNSDTMILQFGIMFLLTGIAFKLGAVPFHMWVPDTYQGASTPITLLISTIPKLAGFGMAYRVLDGAFGSTEEFWQPIVMIMAVASVLLGNIAAIMQTNIKRLLAYSTIGHVGFILFGILVAPQIGYTAALFYVLVYLITTMAAFGVIILLSKHGFEADNIEDLKGLSVRAPWYTFIMLLVMFSLTGIPPLAGFYAKFLVLQQLIQDGHTSLAVVAVIASVIAAFYYLRVVKVMYFDKPEDANTPELVSMNTSGKIILGFNGLSLLAIGLIPWPVVLFCKYALL